MVLCVCVCVCVWVSAAPLAELISPDRRSPLVLSYRKRWMPSNPQPVTHDWLTDRRTEENELLALSLSVCGVVVKLGILRPWLISERTTVTSDNTICLHASRDITYKLKSWYRFIFFFFFSWTDVESHLYSQALACVTNNKRERASPRAFVLSMLVHRTPKWNKGINSISYTCDFPTTSGENVCHEKVSFNRLHAVKHMHTRLCCLSSY